MHIIIIGALVLAVLLGLAQLYVRLDSKSLLRFGRYAIGSLLVAIGLGLTFLRQFFIGLPVIFAGSTILFRGRLGPWDFGQGQRSEGQRSSVRARFIEASLDHDTGELDGRVVEGRFAGKELGDLSEFDLQDLYREVGIDPESQALLEAYLDRRFPGWRGDGEEDDASGPGGAPDAGAMTDKEAYEILGLAPGAGEAEIRAAHRRLLKAVHPDQGGSTFLAARINQAKDRLLGDHH